MDEVSPAVVGIKSGWEQSKLSSEEIACTIADGADSSSSHPTTFPEPLSNALNAATVTLMEEEYVRNSVSPAGGALQNGEEVIVLQDGQNVTVKAELEENTLLEEMSVNEVVPMKRLPPPSLQSNITVVLDSADLWAQFYQAGTEMIITKTGRRMFPSIVIDLSGLEPDSKYSISLEINPADTHRYKFVNSRWVFAGKGESHDETMLVFHHPESPSTGKHWMKNKVSFKKIKLSNNRNNKRGQVVALNSMHKYLPRVVISKVISKKKSAVVHSEDLEKCIFVAVTAYQNDQVTQLKIDYNPFAKAFRDTGADQHYSDYGSTVGTTCSNVGMMSAWPPLSPLLSPYGDSQAALMSPASLQPSPLPQFNTAFGSFESSPPYSPLPAYRQMPASNPVLQQQSVFGLPGQQPRPSPIPRFNSVFNNWETHPNPSSPLTQNVGSAFLIPPSQQPPTTLA